MELPQLSDTEFSQLQTLMRQVSGIIMADHKKQLVAGRLMKRLKALGCRNFSEYVHLLSDPGHQDERRLAVDLLTTNETFFSGRRPTSSFYVGFWRIGILVLYGYGVRLAPRERRFTPSLCCCMSCYLGGTIGAFLARICVDTPWKLPASASIP